MTTKLGDFAARLRESFLPCAANTDLGRTVSKHQSGAGARERDEDFNALALELFSLQFAANETFRKLCESRGVNPTGIRHWTQIPAVPTGAFKEFDLTCLPPHERTRVFHSSGTSGQQPSRHFHSEASLEIYEASVWPWFRSHLLPELSLTSVLQAGSRRREKADSHPRSQNNDPPPHVGGYRLLILTPTPAQAPHSSLVHMFDVIRRKPAQGDQVFVGGVESNGTWTLDLDATHDALLDACNSKNPLILLGTAFSFVHLLDWLSAQGLRFPLPPGSRVMETGGYKGRSRSLSKAALYALITRSLGIPASHIACEYGMSELSSQAYNRLTGDAWQVTRGLEFNSCHPSPAPYQFQFPPWARVQIVSPENGREVADGETGLIRVFDLANVFSVLAVQTEDLGVGRGGSFELIGRAALTEPRGCSLMAA